MPHTENRDWTVEFDERFPTWPDLDGFRSCYLDGAHCSTSAYKIRDFIRKVEKDTLLKAADIVGRVGNEAKVFLLKDGVTAYQTAEKNGAIMACREILTSLSEGNKNK